MQSSCIFWSSSDNARYLTFQFTCKLGHSSHWLIIIQWNIDLAAIWISWATTGIILLQFVDIGVAVNLQSQGALCCLELHGLRGQLRRSCDRQSGLRAVLGYCCIQLFNDHQVVNQLPPEFSSNLNLSWRTFCYSCRTGDSSSPSCRTNVSESYTWHHSAIKD